MKENNFNGAILRKLLKERGMTQRDFAAEFGVMEATVGNWVTGKTKPPTGKIKQIAGYFSVSEEYLSGEYCKMRIVLSDGAKMPTRAYGNSAGLDLYSRETQIVPAKGRVLFDTGVAIELPPNTTGFIKSKSGLYINYGITSEGVVDVGYTGNIRVHLINHGDYDYTVNAGDKISQLVIFHILMPEMEIVTSLKPTKRGNKGFGSSGK